MKKKTKIKSKTALLRENTKLAKQAEVALANLRKEQAEFAHFKNEAAGATYKLRSRVQTLEERLDGIFTGVKHCFHVYAHAPGPEDISTRPIEVSCSGVRLGLGINVDDFRMYNQFSKDGVKAHIKDMLLRQAADEIEKALRVL